jgi:hypothetical protein
VLQNNKLAPKPDNINTWREKPAKQQRIEPMLKAITTLMTLGLSITGLLATYEWAPNYAITIGLAWITLAILSFKDAFND